MPLKRPLPNELMQQTFGSIVRFSREKRGLSKSDLAREVGISITHLSKIENDESEPTIGVAGRIAKILGIPLEAVLSQILTPEEVSQELSNIFEKIGSQIEPNLLLRGFGYKEKKKVVEMLKILEQEQIVRKKGEGK